MICSWFKWYILSYSRKGFRPIKFSKTTKRFIWMWRRSRFRFEFWCSLRFKSKLNFRKIVIQFMNYKKCMNFILNCRSYQHFLGCLFNQLNLNRCFTFRLLLEMIFISKNYKNLGKPCCLWKNDLPLRNQKNLQLVKLKTCFIFSIFSFLLYAKRLVKNL